MRVIALLLCVLASLPAGAGRRRAVAPPGTRLSIEFVQVPAAETTLIATGSDAWVDVRAVSQQAGSTGNTVSVRRKFGVRVVRAGSAPFGRAMVTARLNGPDGRSSLRINGQPLSSMPIVVSAHVEIGVTTIHVLDIDVAASVPAGPLAASISWEVTTQ
jgi:hypothetical protein